MNCTQIEKLIPLFTGGDLPAEEETAVRNHLATCEQCAGIAGEYDESRDWLRGFAMPQFDQGVFDDLRDRVRTTIARAQTQPSLLELLTPIWSRWFALASASALALLAIGMIIYHNRQTVPQPDLSRKGRNEAPRTKTGNSTSAVHTSGEQQKTTAKHRSRRSKIFTLPYTETPDPKTIALESYPIDLRLVIGEAVNLDVSQTADTVEEMLRFEFQTADPNIRIIWLTPKESKSNGETR
jgi:Putative zinc-finger